MSGKCRLQCPQSCDVGGLVAEYHLHNMGIQAMHCMGQDLIALQQVRVASR